jgi:hypothetical protein
MISQYTGSVRVARILLLPVNSDQGTPPPPTLIPKSSI